MSEQSIDDLIGNLTDELEPVKKLSHPLTRALPWLVAACVYVALVVSNVGIRPDFIAQTQNTVYAFEILLAAFIAITATLASVFLSVPDMRGQKWLLTTVLTSAGVFTLWTALRGIKEGMYLPQLELDHCMGEGMFMAIVPLTVLLFMMRNGTTTRPTMMTTMNMLAAGSLGYIGLRITCVMDGVQHVTVSHLLPYLLLGGILGMLARRLYSW